MKPTKAGRVTADDVERTLRIIDDPSATPQQKMRALATLGAIHGAIQLRIACWIERRTPIPVEETMEDLHEGDPVETEVTREAERHAIGRAGDGGAEGIRKRTRSGALACAELDPAVALEKASRRQREVARSAEILRGAKRIGGAATEEEVEAVHVRANAVAEAMLEAQLTLARQVAQRWLER